MAFNLQSKWKFSVIVISMITNVKNPCGRITSVEVDATNQTAVLVVIGTPWMRSTQIVNGVAF